MKATPKMIQELIRLCDDSDAAFGKVVFMDDDNRPIGAVIVVEGDRMADILDAIEEVEAKWNREDD